MASLKAAIVWLVFVAAQHQGSAFQLGSFSACTLPSRTNAVSLRTCRPSQPVPAVRSGRSSASALQMVVGETVQIAYADVGEVQQGLAAAIADGCQVIEVEVPTTNRFKDAALSQIYEANTIFARELVRMFTQPAELCMVFPDESECKIALAEYGGQVPFSFSCLRKPKLQAPNVYYYMVMHPVAPLYLAFQRSFRSERELQLLAEQSEDMVFDVREYIQAEELFRDEVQPKGGSMVIFNGELFKLRSGGVGGYYPDFFFPKLAQARQRLMPQVNSAYYFRIFRGPPVGALYKKYPGPWQVLKAVASEEGSGGSSSSFEVLWEGDQQEPPKQDFVFQTLRSSV